MYRQTQGQRQTLSVARYMHFASIHQMLCTQVVPSVRTRSPTVEARNSTATTTAVARKSTASSTSRSVDGTTCNKTPTARNTEASRTNQLARLTPTCDKTPTAHSRGGEGTGRPQVGLGLGPRSGRRVPAKSRGGAGGRGLARRRRRGRCTSLTAFARTFAGQTSRRVAPPRHGIRRLVSFAPSFPAQTTIMRSGLAVALMTPTAAGGWQAKGPSRQWICAIETCRAGTTTVVFPAKATTSQTFSVEMM